MSDRVTRLDLVGDTCTVLGIAVILLSVYASLRALGGMPRSRQRFRASVLRVYPAEVLIVLTLIAVALLDQANDRVWLYWTVAVSVTVCLLRGVRLMEHGIVVGPRFVSWSQIVGHNWIEDSNPKATVKTLVIRPSGHQAIRLQVPAELQATLDDLVSNTARPEPQPLSRVLAYWLEHLLVLALVALCVALAWRFLF